MDQSSLQVHRQPATVRLIVEDRLREAIFAGFFKPGERLTERVLCELTGVGRTSIREALRQLEAEGLVETIPHRGPVVASLSKQDASFIYETRIILECHAVRRFAIHGSDLQIQELRRATDELKSQVALGGTWKQLLAAKSGIYNAIFEGCGNPILRQTLQPLHNRVNLLRLASYSRPGRLPNSVRELEELYTAIAARDPGWAEQACRHHIEQAALVALDVLENGGDDSKQI